MEETDLLEIIKKYEAGTCTPEEKRLLESWYAGLKTGRTSLSEEQLLQAEAMMRAKIFARTKKRRKYLMSWRVAAACIAGLIIGSGLYLLVKQPYSSQPVVIANAADDTGPGSNKAVLTLADGSTVVLDSAATGHIAVQKNSNVIKTDSGQIAYQAAGNAGIETASPAYNTLYVPKAAQFKVVLPDGTKVWLNAASVLKYPVSFAGQPTREVYLSGEGYFEATHNSRQPFIVKSDQQEVKILGTHFNINAYPDNALVKTTLLEGSLQVKSLLSHDSCILVPGRQAVLGQGMKVQDANPEDVTDWKDGYFIFDREYLDDILTRVSRWYNVDIIYKSDVRKVRLDGIISRNTHISEVLALLQSAGSVHFKIADGKVYVTK